MAIFDTTQNICSDGNIHLKVDNTVDQRELSFFHLFEMGRWRQWFRIRSCLHLALPECRGFSASLEPAQNLVSSADHSQRHVVNAVRVATAI